MGQDKIVLCDTDVIIEFYRNNPVIISELKAIKQQNIAISTITAGELIYGALNKKELNQIYKDLKNLNVLVIDKKTCDTFLNIMGKYVLSHKLALPDGFIAASALTHDIELYTLNIKDYRFIDGLKFYKKA
ncbi:MAG: type II toxin-antitoxin system VapC family toxin [Saprospiraceae bacterium]|nr:type II toxin-antitoxin system VapC family toxin [Saprospiraceae bacterium]